MSDDETYEPEDAFQLTPSGFEKLHSGDTDDLTEAQLLILRYADGLEAREKGAATVEQIEALIAWYDGVMLGLALIEMVIDGQVYIDVEEDGEPTFSLTSLGQTLAGFDADSIDFSSFDS